VSPAEQRLTLNEPTVTPPHTSDFFVRVFIGMPDAGSDTPIQDPHYAGSFGFFGGGHQEHAAAAGEPKAGFVVDVTDTIRRLRQDGSLPDASRVPVRLVAVPHAGRTPEVRNFTLEKLELAVIRQDQTKGWR
jgi:tyrosinase